MCLLHVSAGTEFQDLVRYPEISIRENSMTFITGPSGCGKSTLLRLLNATVLPTAGRIEYQGSPLGGLPVLDYRKQVLLAPQQVYLCEGNVADQFAFFYGARGQECVSRAEMVNALEICRMPLSPEDSCANLSGGERQRVFLSIYLSARPKVLLLDEPTAALDEVTAREFLGNLKAACRQRGTTVVCVCHSRSLVDEFADEEIRLEARA